MLKTTEPMMKRIAADFSEMGGPSTCSARENQDEDLGEAACEL